MKDPQDLKEPMEILDQRETVVLWDPLDPQDPPANYLFCPPTFCSKETLPSRASDPSEKSEVTPAEQDPGPRRTATWT